MRQRKFFINAIVTMLLLVFLSFCLGACVKNKLSEMEDQELFQYVEDANISIPQGIEPDNIRSMIVELEKNPESPGPVVGWTDIATLFEELRDLVEDYYR